jgi:hypothetical protein
MTHHQFSDLIPLGFEKVLVGEFIISIIVRVHGHVRVKHSQNKITADHLARRAGLYIRQSTPGQGQHNLESQRRQYRLIDRAGDRPASQRRNSQGHCTVHAIRPRADTGYAIAYPSACGKRLAANRSLAKGERVMLERNRLDTFYRELQKPSRIEVNERTAKSNGATDCSEKTLGENQDTGCYGSSLGARSAASVGPNRSPVPEYFSRMSRSTFRRNFSGFARFEPLPELQCWSPVAPSSRYRCQLQHLRCIHQPQRLALHTRQNPCSSKLPRTHRCPLQPDLLWRDI